MHPNRVETDVAADEEIESDHSCRELMGGVAIGLKATMPAPAPAGP